MTPPQKYMLTYAYPLHSDFKIQCIMEVVRINTNKYKNHSTEHSNQPIGGLFNPIADRWLKQLWPEDLAQ